MPEPRCLSHDARATMPEPPCPSHKETPDRWQPPCRASAAPDAQPQVIADCFTLLDQEVAEQSGVSGTAVKIAYKTMNSVMPGHIRFMVESLLPEWWRSWSRTGPTSTPRAALNSATTWPSAATKYHRRCCRSPMLARLRRAGQSSSRRTARSREKRGQARRGRAPPRRRPGAEARVLTAACQPARSRPRRSAWITVIARPMSGVPSAMTSAYRKPSLMRMMA